MVNTTTRPQPGTLTAVTARSGYPLSNKALPSKVCITQIAQHTDWNRRLGLPGMEWRGVSPRIHHGCSGVIPSGQAS